jgi:hypothetical protein
MAISYVGGTGNDVTLSFAGPTLTVVKPTVIVNEGGLALNNGLLLDLQGGVTLSANVGTVVNNGDGTWAWSSPAGNGPASSGTVTITATDDSVPPLSASISFALTVKNVAPVAAAGTVDVLEDAVNVPIPLVASDAGGDALTYEIVTPPLASKATLGAVTGNTVPFTPAPDFAGLVTFTFKASDPDGGVSNLATVTVRVANVNDAPSFVKGADRSHPAAFATAQTVPGWATAISDNDATVVQGLTFAVTQTGGPAIFAVAPAISSAGVLTYRTNGVSGTATLSVVLKDDGGTANGGADTSAAQTFTITVADDSTPPTVAISSPTANASVSENAAGVAITGTASDNKQLAKVEVQLNGGAYVDAVSTITAGGLTASYTLNVTPQPGLNTLNVRSVDAAGFTSAVATRSFTYVVLRPLSLKIIGSGTIAYSPALTSGKAQLGKTYTATATAKVSGNRTYFFDKWDDSGAPDAIVSGAKVTFVMTQALSDDPSAITAKFLPSPFKAGTYRGLVSPASGITPRIGNVGGFTGTLTQSGTMTVTLKVGLRAGYTFVAKIDPQTLKGSGVVSGYHYSLEFDTTPGTERVFGTLSSLATGSCNVSADLSATFTTAHGLPSGMATKYNIILPALDTQPGLTASQYPNGYGIGSVTVTATGTVTLAGTLADGSVVTASTALSERLNWPFVAEVTSVHPSLIAGDVQFDLGQADSDLTAPSLTWVRAPSTRTEPYMSGWPHGIGTYLTGSKYRVPSLGDSIIPVTQAVSTSGNAELEFSGGPLAAPILKNVNVDGKLIKPAVTDSSYTFTVTSSTGAFSGNVKGSDFSTTHKGVILQKGANAGAYGFFLGKNLSGGVTVTAK